MYVCTYFPEVPIWLKCPIFLSSGRYCYLPTSQLLLSTKFWAMVLKFCCIFQITRELSKNMHEFRPHPTSTISSLHLLMAL